MLKRFFSYILITLLSINMSIAQKLTAAIDSSYIELGRHTAIHLELKQSKDKNYVFLHEELDSLKTIEIVDILPPDTVQEGMYIRVSQDVIITSFDSGSHVIPAIKFVDEIAAETLASDDIELEVKVLQQVEVNQEELKIFDIKDIRELPFNWMKLVKILAILILLVGAIWLLWKHGKMLYNKYFKKEEIEKLPQQYVEVLEPHEIALRALEKIKNERVYREVEDGVKIYYTELTDVLRTYFSERFGIAAHEMTSGQILHAILNDKEASFIANELRIILDKADLAKFAKAGSTIPDCEMCLVKAFYIVQNTIKVKETPAAEESDKSKVEESNEQNTKELNAPTNKMIEEK